MINKMKNNDIKSKKIRVNDTHSLCVCACEFQIIDANLAYPLECSEPFPVFLINLRLKYSLLKMFNHQSVVQLG